MAAMADAPLRQVPGEPLVKALSFGASPLDCGNDAGAVNR